MTLDATRRTSGARMLRTACLATAALLALNGAWMLIDAGSWFASVPGVDETGPLNAHFVHDVGAAYAASALALALAATRPVGGRALAAIALVFLGLHAVGHVADVLTGALDVHHLAIDFPAVGVPALVALWATLRLPQGEGRP